MRAQHLAEGGMLGSVGKNSESPGDGTILTQIFWRALSWVLRKQRQRHFR
jgi:hypothetical protein